MSNNRINNSNGFTLIEVLISMVILVIGILSVMTMLSTAAKGNAEARKMVRALNVAEERMEVFLNNGACSCGTEPDWIEDCTPDTTSITPPDGTSYCKVTVSWKSFGKQKEVFLETLRSDD
ncbi:MAG: prepilin-type N-terminal cleavage/methylation domain-containing protein [Desulfovermiculus sp.]